MDKISFCQTFKNYNRKNIFSDILAGIIIAAISIPISMGYAQIAGLPACYGLYGSVFPILIFALFSTSPQMIFGVDAAPAALVGATLLTMGIEPFSSQAMTTVPVITLFTALWLLLFFFLKAGKLVNYISSPVMGGFISGICTTIILMQVPKLYGETSGTGEVIELIKHIAETVGNIHSLSLVMGVVTLAILLVFKKFFPKFPMAVVVMIVGAVLSYTLSLKDMGVVCLSAVKTGMPSIVLPRIQMENVAEIATASFSIALVIMAETLLAENNFAKKNRYEINDNQEILAFSLGNFASAIFGCCPVNGSVSRTTLGEQYGAKTQLTSVVAGVSMVLILLFGTGFISYLPVPVLTAIVISALLSATEFDLLLQLRKISRLEFFIFLGAFFGVLLLGTINGVLVGIVLSFMAVVKEAAAPPRSFLGLVPGHGEFLELSRFKHAYPIQGVILYRFSSNLFFANVSLFQKDILGSIKEDTKAVIVDASAIGNIDVTAAKSLEILYESLKERGIKLYITEHMAQLNVQLRKLGLGYMIEVGTIRQTMERALADCQIYRPYPLEGVHNSYHDIRRRKAEDAAQELVWAFGEEAEEIIEKHVMDAIGNMKNEEDVDAVLNGFWNQMPLEDQDEWLEHLEAHIQEIVRATGEGEEKLAELIEQRRHQIMTLIEKEHPELAERYREHRASVERQLKENNPKAFEIIRKIRENNNL